MIHYDCIAALEKFSAAQEKEKEAKASKETTKEEEEDAASTEEVTQEKPVTKESNQTADTKREAVKDSDQQEQTENTTGTVTWKFHELYVLMQYKW